jgi:hypothetical protein
VSSGDRRLGVPLIGAAVLGGPVLAFVMSLQGRTRGDFLLLAAACAAAIVLGVWLLFRRGER